MVGDVRSLIGANCRQILMDTAVVVTPGKTRLDKLRSYRVYSAPDGHEWKLPLLVSLLAIRDENWEVLYDGDDDDEVQENDIQTLIDEVTTN